MFAFMSGATFQVMQRKLGLQSAYFLKSPAGVLWFFRLQSCSFPIIDMFIWFFEKDGNLNAVLTYSTKNYLTDGG
jgi:hypothetical protein